jgi:sec-independent protein translocase protein TatA
MDALGPWHLLIIAAFFVMLFGAKRLPEAARSLGRSARIMKSELKGMHDEPEAADLPAAPLVVEKLPVTAREDAPR